MANKGTNFVVSADVLFNGQKIPFTEFSVDINNYSMASGLEVTVPRSQVNGFDQIPDFGAVSQQIAPVGGVRAVPIEFRVGYDTTKVPTTVLEQGFMDEADTNYGDREVTLAGRGQASIFQDIQYTTPVERSAGGDRIVSQFFAKYAPSINLTTEPSPAYAGKTIGDPVYNTTMRARSVWDEMQAFALADGFILRVHASQAYYGPPPTSPPTLTYTWGQSLSDGTGIVAPFNIRHSPRRSNKIKVTVRSYLRGGKTSTFGQFGNASSTDGETFEFFVSGLNRQQCNQRAQKIYYDIASREYLATMTIVPNVAFMQMVQQNGAAFSINLQGDDLVPSHKIVYGVRQVRFDYRVGRGQLPLLATVVMGNINPINAGAELT